MDNQNPESLYHDKESFIALAELDKKERTLKARQGYWMSYIWSILLPPIGIYFLVKYIFFSEGTEEDVKAGIISCVLTIISLILSIVITVLLFRQTTSSLPAGSKDILKELITPTNQKDLQQLYQ